MFADYFILSLLIISLIGALIYVIWGRKQPASFVRALLHLSTVLLPMMLVVLTLRLTVFDVYLLTDGHLEPEYRNGHFIIINKCAYSLKIPLLNRAIVQVSTAKREDIAAYLVGGQTQIERILAVEGDLIERLGNRWFVNGQMVRSSPNSANKNYRLKVPAGHVWLAPANQKWPNEYGLISVSELMGKAF